MTIAAIEYVRLLLPVFRPCEACLHEVCSAFRRIVDRECAGCGAPIGPRDHYINRQMGTAYHPHCSEGEMR
jgi:hypothetical protein